MKSPTASPPPIMSVNAAPRAGEAPAKHQYVGLNEALVTRYYARTKAALDPLAVKDLTEQQRIADAVEGILP